MRPLRYDFPHRVRHVGGAQRELRRLERSMTVAYHRRDKFALDYLTRRHQRAEQAYRRLLAQQPTTDN
ncbi:hypothetical protein ACIBPB_22665 [Micromonospora sp. NPDC049836]|uniref:hypothetical protein n=1 Tax=Micromonospora sp. NPDC049836 TaxID=3364274 RepID=UPI00378A426A